MQHFRIDVERDMTWEVKSVETPLYPSRMQESGKGGTITFTADNFKPNIYFVVKITPRQDIPILRSASYLDEKGDGLIPNP